MCLSISYNLRKRDLDQYSSLKQILVPGSIPNSVSNLMIDHLFFKHDPHQLIPISVTELNILYWNYASGETNLIPVNVKRIFIGCELNSAPIGPGCFPSTLSEIYFTNNLGSFNQFSFSKESFSNVPLSALSLASFSNRFNIDDIPLTVKHLNLEARLLTQIEPPIFPLGIKSLNFSNLQRNPLGPYPYYKNRDPPGPPITLPTGFNILPNTLTHLIGVEGSSEFIHQLTALEYLDCCFTKLIIGQFPPSLKTLLLRRTIESIQVGSIPESVTRLDFLNSVSFLIEPGMIPNSCLSLDIIKTHQTCIGIGSIPNSVEDLHLGILKTPLYQGILPPNIKSLEIRSIEDLTNIHIPSSIQYLDFPVNGRPEKYQLFYDLLIKLFSQAESQLVIKLKRLKLLSIGKDDPYVYFINEEFANFEGFLLKSKINTDLYDKLICFQPTYFKDFHAN
eukprot:gene12018-14699_t